MHPIASIKKQNHSINLDNKSCDNDGEIDLVKASTICRFCILPHLAAFAAGVGPSPSSRSSLLKLSPSSSNLSAVPSLLGFLTLPATLASPELLFYIYFISLTSFVVISRLAIRSVENRVSAAPRAGVLERACRSVTTPGLRAIFALRMSIRTPRDLSMAWLKPCLAREPPKHAAPSAQTVRTPVV